MSTNKYINQGFNNLCMIEDQKMLSRFFKIISHHLNEFHSSKADLWWDSLIQKQKNKILRGNEKCKK